MAGGKELAWTRFRDGNYMAVGWLYETDLTGMSIKEILRRIRNEDYEPGDMQDGLASFPNFLRLKPGDFVGVKNVNWGLFGIGIIDSKYKYEPFKHLAEPPDHIYPHYYEVKWLISEYVSARDLRIAPETAWKPRGTVGQLYQELREYFKRVLRGAGYLREA
jgi:hypothetical protein